MARARRTDPITSHEAAHEAEATGRAGAQREICMAEVMKHPGQTAAEIAVAVSLERHAPSRRLPELRDAGFVKNGRARMCRSTRRLSITWYPAEGAQS